MTDSCHSDIIDLTLSDEDSLDLPTLCDSPVILSDDGNAIQQAADFDEPFVQDEPETTSDFDIPPIKNDPECVLVSDDSFCDLRYFIAICRCKTNM